MRRVHLLAQLHAQTADLLRDEAVVWRHGVQGHLPIVHQGLLAAVGVADSLVLGAGHRLGLGIERRRVLALGLAATAPSLAGDAL